VQLGGIQAEATAGRRLTHFRRPLGIGAREQPGAKPLAAIRTRHLAVDRGAGSRLRRLTATARALGQRGFHGGLLLEPADALLDFCDLVVDFVELLFFVAAEVETVICRRQLQNL
jgi:hypothetical protein